MEVEINRPNEINSLIQSITNQSFKDLEILVVEDGSVISSEKAKSQFRYSINGKSAVSMDQVAMEQGEDEKLNIYQTDLFLKAGWPRLKFKSKLKITSEESQFKQPKNRYFATRIQPKPLSPSSKASPLKLSYKGLII